MVRETQLAVDDFIYPLFVCPGKKVRKAVGSMPGVFQLSVDETVTEAKKTADAGIPSVILFGIPSKKDKVGSEAWDDNGVVQRACREIKKARPELVVTIDACFCEYTSHGHCGVLTDGGEVDNDATLENLGRAARSYARAGCDIVAPSGMMDGMVGFIRDALDEEGFDQTAIMAYSAKYASGYYGPFRDAAESAPQFGDRKAYQMDPANSLEAIREVSLDVEEGADIIMVKPALAYLDIIARVRDEFELPLAAYNVSGEYSMLKAAGERGWIDYDRVMMETLTGIKRAGADLILTYHALEAAAILAKR
jgi:porphobilinogen synthase